ncbi:MAG: hypothetical protein Q9M28_09965 [Mariprofundaceae bacterium]|nr:hypothetical protein [Mariprofundaceae bacterium]
MGFFDKVKAMKNAVTGGAAKVYLDCDKLSYDEPFKVVVRAQTADASVKVSRVYLNIIGEEQVNVPDVDVVYDSDGDGQRRVENVRASVRTVELEITVAEGQELEANESYEWEVEIELPTHAPSIYDGRFCQHGYRAFAALDCFGNDPDSGWIELHD